MAFTGSNAPNGLGGTPVNNSSKAWYQAGGDSFSSRTSLRQEAPAQKGRQRGGVYWPSRVRLTLLAFFAYYTLRPEASLQAKSAAQVESKKRALHVLQHISKSVIKCTSILCKAACLQALGQIQQDRY